MLVCKYCLQAIESHEGHQIKRKLDYCDERQNDDGEIICEWCEERFDVCEIYEI
jgi:hypothetical protein